MLGVDLYMHRDHHAASLKEAAIWSAVWVAFGLTFSLVIYLWEGGTAASEYLTGYVIEKSLSVDNIFVFALIFSYFSVKLEHQHNVLFWGIFGALVFRFLFIFAGTALLEQFHWMIYVFGGFLVVTGIRMFFSQDEEVHPERNPVLKFIRRFLPMSKDYDEGKFFTVENGKRLATPMLAVLCVVETTDIVFAVDSIPAILAITQDRFIVFTSNAFAILGLRALYFLLAGIMDRFIYLKAGLAIVLTYVGVKMLSESFFEIPTLVSLGIIAVTITISIVWSLRSTSSEAQAARASDKEQEKAQA
jgi:tellurite resistance protein TerC